MRSRGSTLGRIVIVLGCCVALSIAACSFSDGGPRRLGLRPGRWSWRLHPDGLFPAADTRFARGSQRDVLMGSTSYRR